MKTLNLLLALLICGVAQAQVTMHIHYSNGTTLDIPGAEIDSVYYPLEPMNHAVYLTNDDVQSDPMMLIDSVTFSGVPLLPLTCLDGIQNNGEDAPDCGGPCPPCGTCADGIQNEVWVPELNEFVMEEGVDCGEPCPVPCSPGLCNDGVWNGFETYIDCGGPDCLECATYLNAGALGGTPFFGEGFTVELIGSNMIFSATQTVGGLTRTLRIKIPTSADVNAAMEMQPYSSSPSIEYVDYSGTIFQSQTASGSEMVILFKNETPFEGPNYLTGEINFAELLDIDMSSGATVAVKYISFGFSYE